MSTAYIRLRRPHRRRPSQWPPLRLASRRSRRADAGRASSTAAASTPRSIDDVILGCVMQVGEQAVNVARNAVLASKLPESVPGTSIDRQCGSSQQALHFAAQAVMAGSMDLVIAGGVESMTRVPLGASVALAKQAGMGGYMSPGDEAALRRHRVQPVRRRRDAGEELRLRPRRARRLVRSSRIVARPRRRRAGCFDDEILPLPVRLADGSGDGLHCHRRRHPLRRDARVDRQREAAARGRRASARRARARSATARPPCWSPASAPSSRSARRRWRASTTCR